MQCKTTQCVSTSIRNGKVVAGPPGSDKGRGDKGVKGKSKKGGRGKERNEKLVRQVEGECMYCRTERHKKAEFRKMKADIAAGKCVKQDKPTGVNSLTSILRHAVSSASELCAEHGKHHLTAADGPSALPESYWHSTETWFINMIIPAQKTPMVASLDGAEYAFLDSGSGLTSCPMGYADDLALRPRPSNLLILSIATGGSVECIGRRQVGYRLENGEPFSVTWHVANVTYLIISTDSLIGANIEVRHATNESSVIKDRAGT